MIVKIKVVSYNVVCVVSFHAGFHACSPIEWSPTALRSPILCKLATFALHLQHPASRAFLSLVDVGILEKDFLLIE